MSQEVSDAFVKQYESDVFVAYQRMGSKLRSTVRTKSNVKGSSTTFQKVGTGSAVRKARHAEIATMEVAHDPIECVLEDWYAGDYIDKLDELKINMDERKVAADAGAYALGRKSDELIVNAMDTTTNVIAHGGTGLTQAKIDTVFAWFGNNSIPDDGGRSWVVSAAGWLDLLGITAFSSADFIGQDQLPYKGGMSAKRWLSFMWFEFSGLPGSASDRTTFAYHKTAVGHASGLDITSEINYVPQRVAHLATSFMSQGACLIEPIGVYEVHFVE
jgi:capsid protein